MGMQILIENLNGETVAVDFTNVDEIKAVYIRDDAIKIDGQIFRLSTARSVERVGVQEAASILRSVVAGEDVARDAGIWLALWGDV